MLPSTQCDIPTEVCCTTIYDVADWLKCQVYDALQECYPAQDCADAAPLLAYITHGNGDDGIRDALTVAIVSTSPSPKSSSTDGRQIGINLNRSTFRVMLRESGWPMAHTVGDDIYAPDPVAQNALARHSYSHGERMYRRLNALRIGRKLVPDTMPQPSTAAIGALTPLPPLGGVVGWYVDVQLDMVW